MKTQATVPFVVVVVVPQPLSTSEKLLNILFSIWSKVPFRISTIFP